MLQHIKMRKVCNKSSKPRIIFYLFLVVSLLVPMSSAFAADDEPVYGGTLIAGIPQDLKNLNAAIYSATRTGQQLSMNLFDGLLRHSMWGDGAYTPVLAKSWKVSGDGLTYTLNLEQNVKWHDGKPFTSADVKFSLLNITRPYHPVGKANFDVIENIDTPDLYTVVIKLRHKDAAFLSKLDPKQCAIAPKHLYEGTDIPNNPYNWKPIGTGPFKFKEWVKGSHLIFEKNENYWRKDPQGRSLPYLDRIVLQVIPDATTMIASLEAGNIDYIPPLDVVPSVEAKRLNAQKGIKVIDWDYANKDIYFLFYNMKRKITGNADVRKAIAHLVNEKDIADRIFTGYAVPMSASDRGFLTWFTGTIPRYYEPNIAIAEKLLDKAGFPKNKDGVRFKINMTVSQEAEDFRKMAEIMASSFKQAGIELQMTIYDSAGVNDKVYMNLDYDLHIQTVAVGPDPFFMEKTWHSKNIGKGWITNASGYSNTKVDELLESGLLTLDTVKRKKIYSDIQNIVIDDLPMLPLVSSRKYFIFNDNLGGFPIGYTYRESWEKIYWKSAVPEKRK
jgi:peptide/nickel transport system substrate-binding protein